MEDRGPQGPLTEEEAEAVLTLYRSGAFLDRAALLADLRETARIFSHYAEDVVAGDMEWAAQLGRDGMVYADLASRIADGAFTAGRRAACRAGRR